MTAISLVPGLIEVTVFGGSARLCQYYNDMESMQVTVVLTFGELVQYATRTVLHGKRANLWIFGNNFLIFMFSTHHTWYVGPALCPLTVVKLQLNYVSVLRFYGFTSKVIFQKSFRHTI